VRQARIDACCALGSAHQGRQFLERQMTRYDRVGDLARNRFAARRARSRFPMGSTQRIPRAARSLPTRDQLAFGQSFSVRLVIVSRIA
jgi:hypothetical protein